MKKRGKEENRKKRGRKQMWALPGIEPVPRLLKLS